MENIGKLFRNMLKNFQNKSFHGRRGLELTPMDASFGYLLRALKGLIVCRKGQGSSRTPKEKSTGRPVEPKDFATAKESLSSSVTCTWHL